MSRAFAALFAMFLIAAADGPPPGAALPHASGAPAGSGPGCGGGFTAARGDTLYSIARRCETSVAELVQENRLGQPPRLAPGQRLAVPGFAVGAEPPKPPEVAPPPPPPRPRIRVRTGIPAGLPPPPVPPVPPPPRERADIYHFQAGDTLYSLARWARTSVGALRAANPDVDPRDIEVGDPIRLPPGAARPEPMRLRERGRAAPAPVAATAPPPPPPAVERPRPPAVRPAPPLPPVARPAPPPPGDDADKPKDDEDEDEGQTPGGMDDGGPEPDGM